MVSKAQVKFVRSLALKKFRKQYKSFVAEGDKTVCEIMNSFLKVQTVYATESWVENNHAAIEKSSAEVLVMKQQGLDRMSGLKTAPPVLAVVEIPGQEPDRAVTKTSFNLVLDGLRDPGNMGTIIRIADWFGIKQIFCSHDTADIYNPKVVQATMGSVARVRVYYQDLAALLAQYEMPVYGTTMQGDSLYETILPEKGFLVIGNESRGVSAISQKVGRWISIPGYGGAESLNAGVATGIVLAFWRKNYPALKFD